MREHRPVGTEFQSTLPRGERPVVSPIGSSSRSFQSTLPRGERLSSVTDTAQRSCFNPRSHAGSDCRGECAFDDYEVSIHAPTRGATSSSAQSM